MQGTAAKRQIQSQNYQMFWPSVLMSDRAKSRAHELEILYAAFPRAFQKTLMAVLTDYRVAGAQEGIRVAEILAEEDLPEGIRMSYRFSGEGLLICDLWTPVQPSLF